MNNLNYLLVLTKTSRILAMLPAKGTGFDFADFSLKLLVLEVQTFLDKLASSAVSFLPFIKLSCIKDSKSRALGALTTQKALYTLLTLAL